MRRLDRSDLFVGTGLAVIVAGCFRLGLTYGLLAGGVALVVVGIMLGLGDHHASGR